MHYYHFLPNFFCIKCLQIIETPCFYVFGIIVSETILKLPYYSQTWLKTHIQLDSPFQRTTMTRINGIADYDIYALRHQRQLMHRAKYKADLVWQCATELGDWGVLLVYDKYLVCELPRICPQRHWDNVHRRCMLTCLHVHVYAHVYKPNSSRAWTIQMYD